MVLFNSRLLVVKLISNLLLTSILAQEVLKKKLKISFGKVRFFRNRNKKEI